MHASLPVAIGRLDVRTVGSDVLVHDTQNGKVHVLNRTAATVLALCDGRRDFETIAALIAPPEGVSPARVRDDVERIVGVFRSLGVVEMRETAAGVAGSAV